MNGEYSAAQAAIQREWEKRNTEESPESWAVYEDGEELDAEEALLEEQRQLKQEQEQQRLEQQGEEEKGESETKEQSAGGSDQTTTTTTTTIAASSSIGAPRKKNPRSALRKLYASRKEGNADHASSAFRKRVVSATLTVSLKKQTFDVDNSLDAELIHSNHLPAAFAGAGGITRPQVRSPQEEAEESGQLPAISPRAKVGMRVLSSRATVPASAVTAWGLPSEVPVIGSDKEGIYLPNSTDFHSLDTSTSLTSVPMCPMTQAVGQWQERYWEQLSSVKKAQQDYQSDLEGENKFIGGLSGHLHSAEPPELDEDDLDQLTLLGMRRDVSQVSELELKVEGLTSTTFLRHHRHVKSLNLNVNRLTSLAGLQYLHNIEVLQVRDNALIDISALASIAKLTDVSLDLNHLSDLSALCHHHGLQKLTVRDNQLTTLESFHGINFPDLTRLELYQNELTSVPEHSLRGLTSLTHLDLGRNKLQYISGAALSQYVHLEPWYYHRMT